jgi:transcriptional regulator with XRE-family HTH domain
MKLGTLLKQAREARKWSLSEAGRALGCTKSHLHELEKGKQANPTLTLIAAFVTVYGIPAEVIVRTAYHRAPGKGP